MISLLRRRPFFYAALFLCLSVGLTNRYPVQTRDEGGNVFLRGVIVSDVHERKSFYGRILVSFVLEARHGLVRVYLKDPEQSLSYGDEILLKGELKRPKGLRNPGGFDSRAYLARQGIGTVFFAARHPEIKILGRHRANFLQERAIQIRRFLSARISSEFQKRDADFLKALFLGERSDFDGDFRDLFIKTGTMHILAVSGFNIGFLYLSMLLLLRPLPLSRRTALGAALAAIWLYCLMVGWQAPVVRASWMATVFILGQMLGRKTDALNTLGFAALAILVVNPRQLFDLGFQLSFLAVLGLVVLTPVFVTRPQLLPNERLTFGEKALQYVRELFWASFIASLVTLPVTVQSFYIVTPLSLIANLIVVPLSFALFFSGIIYFLTFGWVPKFLFVLPALMKLLMEFFVLSLFAIENIPGSYFIVGKLNPALWVLLVGGILFFLFDRRMARPWTRAAALFLFCLNIFLAQDILRQWKPPIAAMTVLDVGQGDAIYFEFPGGGNLLIDAGRGADNDSGRRVVAPFLKSQGIRKLDAVVISHPQADHIGGMPAVFDEFKVKAVVDGRTPYPSRLYGLVQRKIETEKADRLRVSEGMKIEGFPGMEVRVLNPSRDEKPSKNINNRCMVLKIIYGKTSFLLTGDIEAKAMKAILNRSRSEEGIRCTVLKVPHHGAKLKSAGEAFIRQVHPEVSVISVGERNAYKHPWPKTVEVLSAIPGNRLFRTDRDGAVRVVSNGLGVAVTTTLDGSDKLAYDFSHADKSPDVTAAF